MNREVRTFHQQQPEVARQMGLFGVTLIEPPGGQERKPRVAPLTTRCDARAKISKERRQTFNVQPLGQATDDLCRG